MAGFPLDDICLLCVIFLFYWLVKYLLHRVAFPTVFLSGRYATATETNLAQWSFDQE